MRKKQRLVYIPKHIAPAARANAVICRGASALLWNRQGAWAPAHQQTDRQQNRVRNPRASPRNSSTCTHSTARLTAGNSGICSIGAKLLMAAILIYLLRNSKSNDRPKIAAFKRPQQVNRATTWEIKLTTLWTSLLRRLQRVMGNAGKMLSLGLNSVIPSGRAPGPDTSLLRFPT